MLNDAGSKRWRGFTAGAEDDGAVFGEKFPTGVVVAAEGDLARGEEGREGIVVNKEMDGVGLWRDFVEGAGERREAGRGVEAEFAARGDALAIWRFAPIEGLSV